MTAPAETDPARAAALDAFVRRQFLWPGSLRLHRAALGGDLLRAPVNLALAPVQLGLRGLGWLWGRLGGRLGGAGLGRWLGTRQILLRMAVAARVEALILSELCAIPLPGPAPDRAALRRALLAAPRLRAPLRAAGSQEAAERLVGRILAALNEYSGARAATAEFTAALILLAIGALAFHSLTPGAISLAPSLAEQLAQSTAIAEFPLGAGLGGLWYGVFPAGPSGGLVALTVAGLVLGGAVLTSLAGALADPVQVWLGVHRRRLARLIAVLEGEIAGTAGAPFIAREPLLARVFDLWDAALSLLRALRG